MDFLQVIALLISVTAIFSFINYRFLKLPTTVGVMLISLVFSLGCVLLGQWSTSIEEMASSVLGQIPFEKTLLHGLLSFLLFAGALHMNLDDLVENKWEISSLATVGLLLSTFVFGSALFWVFHFLGIGLSYLYCLVLGALISPTDPIAVLGILKSAKAPKSMEAKIAGESLFNDGVGVVLFVVLLELATGAHPLSVGHVIKLFLWEALGGVILGLILGAGIYTLLKKVDDYEVEVLLTLGLVMGGYSLATALHTSGPLAIVVAGLLIGNHGRRWAMSDKTREHLDTFWELNDAVLNAILFTLIGFELLVISFSGKHLLAGFIAIPLLLGVRWVSVALPIQFLKRWRTYKNGIISIMTWGGLRGGISVALALSLPAGPERRLLLTVTYVIVIFSILFQGLTMKPLLRRVLKTEEK